MQDNDLSVKFEQISNRAKAATDDLKAAGDTTRDELETDVARARNAIDEAESATLTAIYARANAVTQRV
jgi:hypothetical protein